MTKERRHVPTSELLPPPTLTMPLLFGALAAFAGAAAWAALIVFAHYEVSLLAIAIGSLTGFVIVKAGGHGQLLAVAAAVLTVLAIGTGKHFAYQHMLGEVIDARVAELTAESHAETAEDAADWVALGDKPSDDQVADFALDHHYEVEDAVDFRKFVAPDLEWFAKQQPTLEQWREHVRADLADSLPQMVTFVDYLKDDFHPLDIVFALVGLAAGYGLVMRHTTEMQVAARQRLREERDAERAEAEAELAGEPNVDAG